MLRNLVTLLCALGAGFILFNASVALACDGEHGEDSACSCPEHKSDAKKSKATTAKDVDDAMAGKCTCTNSSDCTCKKGKCECPKCQGKEHTELFERLKGRKNSTQLPDSARNDASAGVFI